jgi:hypothetical protein
VPCTHCGNGRTEQVQAGGFLIQANAEARDSRLVLARFHVRIALRLNLRKYVTSWSKSAHPRPRNMRRAFCRRIAMQTSGGRRSRRVSCVAPYARCIEDNFCRPRRLRTTGLGLRLWPCKAGFGADSSYRAQTQKFYLLHASSLFSACLSPLKTTRPERSQRQRVLHLGRWSSQKLLRAS